MSLDVVNENVEQKNVESFTRIRHFVKETIVQKGRKETNLTNLQG